MTKQCTRCKEIKDVSKFHRKRKYNSFIKAGYQSVCKICNSIICKMKNKISCNQEKWSEYYYKDIKKSRKRKRQIKFIARNSLSDQYIKELLIRRTDLKTSDIPDDLVELKREQLKIIRILRDDSNML